MKRSENNNEVKLSIIDAGKRINKSGRPTIEEWLMRNNITIHRDPRKYVFAIDIETKLLLPLASSYKRNHPSDWKQRIKAVCGENDAVYNMLLIELSNEPAPPPTTRVRPRNEFQEKLLKEMMK